MSKEHTAAADNSNMNSNMGSTSDHQGPEITADKTFAAIDLGSNSFHMAVANSTGAHIKLIDKLREPVRLGAGLDKKNNITPSTMKRALECLSMFSERLRDVPPHQVRAVGTNTLRRARNASEINTAAVETLGVPIEIISGREEARLIYTGVTYGVRDDKKRLVIDIGGGSTEFIAGSGTSAHIMESVNMGCVSANTRWFDNSKKVHKQFDKAIAQGCLEAQAIVPEYLKHNWELCVGSSGTIKATERILQSLNPAANGISREGLEALIEKICKKGPDLLNDISSVSEDRKAVILGGLSVLMAAFQSFNIKHMQVSHAALREGVIIDLAGDSLNDHVRRNAVDDMQRRFQVDTDQAARVFGTAELMFLSAIKQWNLDPKRDWGTLRSACHLHEVGLSVAHVQYHKHGDYLLRHADMLGFSRNDQEFIAALVRNHRRKIDKTVVQTMRKSEQSRYYRLLVLLRLATLLHRTRYSGAIPPVSITPTDSVITLNISADWLEQHPLTRAELEDEIATLGNVGFHLRVQADS